MVEEEIARVKFGIRVPGEDSDAMLARLSQNGRDASLVLNGDNDCVDTASDPVFDEFVLL